MQRIQRGPPVVIRPRVLRRTGDVDGAVGRQGAGREHRRPELPTRRRGEHLTHRAVAHLQFGQIGQVLPPAGRPRSLAGPGLVVLVLQVLPVIVGAIGVGGPLGFVGEVPALLALMHADDPGLTGAGRADRLPSRPARDRDHLLRAGGPVVDPAQHGPAAHPIRCGQSPRILGGDGEVRPSHQAAPSTRVRAGRPEPPRAARSASVWWAKRTRTGSVMPSTWT